MLALAGAASVLAFACDQPLVLAALAVGALVLFLAAPGRPSRWFLVGGALSGLSLALINPFLSAEGDLIIWAGPEVPIIDLEITVEEVAYGIALGVRLFAVAVLIGAALAHLDADRLQAQVARIAPRSALICALAARLLPTLERDAQAIGEQARLRGADLTGGRWSARARRAAPLALPLLGSGLERGLDLAEAMVARGYSAGPRSRVNERRYRAGEWVVLMLAVALGALALVSGPLGWVDYSFYPVMSSVREPAPIIVALGALLALGISSLALRRAVGA
ncbi:MAG TPA: energy-coupling factor transporter transmembrane component T [Miltoncostaeaceae bacterium]|nr:energy-coupling factor transporter transmembrane component T [Miltoncostaeaceae bacterium]